MNQHQAKRLLEEPQISTFDRDELDEQACFTQQSPG